MEPKNQHEETPVIRPPRVAGIILASEHSSPSAGSKLLLPFRGKTVIENVVNSALRSPLYQVVVVLGPQSRAVRLLLTGRAVALVQNSHVDSDPGSSLRAGLLAVSRDADAVLFLPGDQPLVTPELIDILITAYSCNQNPIVVPVCNGKRGAPALFDRRIFQRIQSLGDAGVHSLFGEFSDQIMEVAVADSSIHFAITNPNSDLPS